VFKGRVTARPVSCRRFNVDAWVRYHAHLLKVFGGHVVVGQLFLQVLVFPFSIILPIFITHVHLHATCCLLPEGKMGEALQPSKNPWYFGNRGALGIKVFISFVKRKLSYTNQKRVEAWLGLLTALHNGAVCCSHFRMTLTSSFVFGATAPSGPRPPHSRGF